MPSGATLRIDRETADAGGRSVEVLALAGTLDGSTLPALEFSLEQESHREQPVVILRLAQVAYVNSTGMGLFIKYADRLKAVGGALCFVEMPAKILSLFRMLGLASALRIYPDLAGALSALRDSLPPPGATEAASPPPAAVRFPLTVSCAGCRTDLGMGEPGYYKCPNCGGCYLAEEGKPLRVFRSECRAPFEMSFPYDAGYLDAIRFIVSRMAESAGFRESEREGLATAARRLLEALISRVNGKGKALRLLVAAEPGECLVGIRSDVRVMGAEDPALPEIRSATDRFEVAETSGGGTLFKLARRAGVPPKAAT